MTRWKKRIMTMVTAVAMMVTLSVPALALGDIELNTPGSIELTVPEGEDGAYRADLNGAAVTVAAYKVASVNEHGVFTLEAAFGALAENAEWKGGILNRNTKLEDLLTAAQAIVYPAPAEPVEPGTEPEAAFEPTLTAEGVVTDGKLAIELGESGLGLYLLLPEKAETTQYVYTFSPVLLAVPSIQREGEAITPPEGEQPEAPTDGTWLYAVPVVLKGERTYRLTELVIDKRLAEYNATLGATTFVFAVEGTLDGENVYSNVVSVTFEGAGTQSVTVSGIPVGADVTVTEVYTGASYQVSNGQVSVDIEELPLAEDGNYTRVAFTNTYTNERIPDGSVVNTFQYNGEGWAWQSGEEAGQ